MKAKRKEPPSFHVWRVHSNTLDWMSETLPGDKEIQMRVERACFLAYTCGVRHEKWRNTKT